MDKLRITPILYSRPMFGVLWTAWTSPLPGCTQWRAVTPTRLARWPRSSGRYTTVFPLALLSFPCLQGLPDSSCLAHYGEEEADQCLVFSSYHQFLETPFMVVVPYEDTNMEVTQDCNEIMLKFLTDPV